MNSEDIHTRPHLWRLGLHLDGHAIHALASSTVDDSEPVAASKALAAESVAALEEAVYTLPGLVDDYAKVDVIVRTPAYTVVPEDLPEAAASDAADLLGFGHEGEAPLLRTPLLRTQAHMLWAVEPDLHNFLARTFRNPRMHNALAVLSDYFTARAMGGNAAKTFVHFHGLEAIDLLSYDSAGRLLLISSKRAATDADALYFIMAQLKAVAFEARADRLLLCGDRRRREQLAPVLRKYIQAVLPVIFPSGACSKGAENLPFPLTVFNLCES